MTEKYPDREECMRLLKEYGTPDRVVRHCIAVTDAALKAAAAVRKVFPGLNVDFGLLEAAGLLHDIARVEKRHEIAGSEYVRGLGYGAVADIIRKHMTYSEFHELSEAVETDFLCLGDRVVREDKYVGADARIDYVIEKAKRSGRPGAEEAVRKKKKVLIKFLDRIEAATGKSIDEICGPQEK